MKPGRLFCMLLFLWASTLAVTDVNSQTLKVSPAVSPEQVRIIDLNTESDDFKDRYDMESRKTSIISGASSGTSQFLKDDLREAFAAVLRDNPDL